MREKIRLAEMNNAQFEIGDTIRAYLPIGEYFGKTSTFYFTSAMPKYPEGVDSLGLTGIIHGKDYGNRYPDGKDSTDLIFHLRVLSLSKENVLISGMDVRRGDTMHFHVTGYGRLIDDY